MKIMHVVLMVISTLIANLAFAQHIPNIDNSYWMILGTDTIEVQITEDLYAHNDTQYKRRTPLYNLKIESPDTYKHTFPKYIDTLITEDIISGKIETTIDSASSTRYVNYLGRFPISLLPALSDQLFKLYSTDTIYNFTHYYVRIQDEFGRWHSNDYVDDHQQDLNEFLQANKSIIKEGNIISVSNLQLFVSEEFQLSYFKDSFSWKLIE